MSKAQDQNPNPLKNLPIFTAVHPESRPYFRDIAAPKKIIKEGRSNISMACAQCRKLDTDGVSLQKCGKVRYIACIFPFLPCFLFHGTTFSFCSVKSRGTALKR